MPTAVVNYDLPQRRETLDVQIKRALRYKKKYDLASHIFLVKPEPRQHYIQVDRIIQQLDRLAGFDIIPTSMD